MYSAGWAVIIRSHMCRHVLPTMQIIFGRHINTVIYGASGIDNVIPHLACGCMVYGNNGLIRDLLNSLTVCYLSREQNL